MNQTPLVGTTRCPRHYKVVTDRICRTVQSIVTVPCAESLHPEQVTSGRDTEGVEDPSLGSSQTTLGTLRPSMPRRQRRRRSRGNGTSKCGRHGSVGVPSLAGGELGTPYTSHLFPYSASTSAVAAKDLPARLRPASLKTSSNVALARCTMASRVIPEKRAA